MSSQPDFYFPLPPLNFWQGLRYCHDPRLVWYHTRQVVRAENLVMGLTGAPRETVREAMYEVWRDEAFLRDFLGRHRQLTKREPRGTDFMFLSLTGGSPYFHPVMLYTLVRVMKPAVVVETGGTPGNSSAFILRALDRNQYGELHTVDLPPTGTLGEYDGDGIWIHAGLPEGQGSGWAVPEWLRGRHHQHLGDAKILLPGVLEQVGQVDIFIHDSDHSYEHMAWEFAAAWPAVVAGGSLLSDDIRANTAFDEFVSQHQLTPLRAGGFGAVRKPG